MGMSETVLFRLADGVATITLNKPDVRNATSPVEIARLTDLVDRIHADPGVRCVLLTGQGDHFCGGGDVRSFCHRADTSPDARRAAFHARIMASSRLFEQLETLRCPVVVRARGAVAGAGIGLALAADLTFVSDTAVFVFAQSRIGLPLDSAVSYYLPRAVGPRRAKALTLFEQRLNAARALELGLATQVVPDAELDDIVAVAVARLAAGPTRAFAQSKAILRDALTRTLPEQIAAEADAVAACAASDDFAEGIAAFVGKRPTRFTGR